MKWKCLKKWTPGNAQPHPVVVADDEPQTVIAHVQHDEHAALIASAPDMLAALEATRDMLICLMRPGEKAADWTTEANAAIVQGWAAIEKARGAA